MTACTCLAMSEAAGVVSKFRYCDHHIENWKKKKYPSVVLHVWTWPIQMNICLFADLSQPWCCLYIGTNASEVFLHVPNVKR